MRPANELCKHPAYAELQLSVSPAQFVSIKRLGESAFKDPLLVTRQGVIIACRALRGSDDSRHRHRRCPDLQEPFLGTANGERRNRSGVRGLLFAIF